MQPRSHPFGCLPTRDDARGQAPSVMPSQNVYLLNVSSLAHEGKLERGAIEIHNFPHFPAVFFLSPFPKDLK